MPKIKNSDVLEILENQLFASHVAMHLAREGLIQPPPFNFTMTPLDKKGSGREFLEMHHVLLRVFRHFLEAGKLRYEQDLSSWDLDDPRALPGEIQDLFRNTSRPNYLGLVFKGVEQRTKKVNKAFKDAADDLGRFIEQGDDNKTPGSGVHDTLHEYLGSKEGGFAEGAEMNKLRASLNNDYFWQLHKWIDGQYQRLAEKYGKKFDTKAISPQDAMMHMAGTKMRKKTMRGTKTKMGTMKMGKAAGT